jgi:hypothetical protein
MTSTPVVFLLKRSGLASDRPSGTILTPGEPAICFAAVDPGVYFEDSAGSIRKVGPPHYGTSGPNSTPAGLPGNSIGELWTDSNGGYAYLKVWTGAAWKKVDSGYADVAGTALSGTFASQADTAILASGAVLASGAIGARIASGTLIASGAITANTATLSSGSVLASGAIGAFLASGAISASGAVSANTATLASGCILASGVVAGASVVSSGLPTAASYPSGTFYYTVYGSGAFTAGLYIRASDTWLLV